MNEIRVQRALAQGGFQARQPAVHLLRTRPRQIGAEVQLHTWCHADPAPAFMTYPWRCGWRFGISCDHSRLETAARGSVRRPTPGCRDAGGWPAGRWRRPLPHTDTGAGGDHWRCLRQIDARRVRSSACECRGDRDQPAPPDCGPPTRGAATSPRSRQRAEQSCPDLSRTPATLIPNAPRRRLAAARAHGSLHVPQLPPSHRPRPGGRPRRAPAAESSRIRTRPS